MNDALRVRTLERARDRREDLREARERELRVTDEERAQRLAVQALHHDGRRAVLELDDVVHLHDVRVPELSGDAALAKEPAPLLRRLRLQDLQRHDAMGTLVRGLPDDAHAAFAELLLEPETCRLRWPRSPSRNGRGPAETSLTHGGARGSGARREVGAHRRAGHQDPRGGPEPPALREPRLVLAKRSAQRHAFPGPGHQLRFERDEGRGA